MIDNAMPSSDPASTADASGTSRDTIAPSASSARKQPSKGRGARSRQDWQTPPEFLAAVKRKFKFSEFTVDLAATCENAVCDLYCDRYFMPAFSRDWPQVIGFGVGWLNPPFERIGPWAEKALETLNTVKFRGDLFMLVPAAVGSNWWRDCVHQQARVYLLNGRITFVGADDPYPKDCSLLHYNRHTKPGYEVWSWRK